MLRVKNSGKRRFDLYGKQLYVDREVSFEVWDDELVRLVKTNVLEVLEGDLFENKGYKGYQGSGSEGEVEGQSVSSGSGKQSVSDKEESVGGDGAERVDHTVSSGDTPVEKDRSEQLADSQLESDGSERSDDAGISDSKQPDEPRSESDAERKKPSDPET